MESPSELEAPQSSSATPDEATPAVNLAGLRAAVVEGRMDHFEELWMEAIESSVAAAANFEELLGAAEAYSANLAASNNDALRSRLGDLLELLLSVATPETPPRAVLRLYAMLVSSFPNKRQYLSGFTERFEELYPVASAERAFYQVCGFPSCPDPRAGLRRLDRLMQFKEGAYVFHGSGWGFGRIISVDPFLKQVQVDLEHKQGHRIAIDAVDAILQPLDPNSFSVLRFKKSPKLEELRENDPVALVSLVLESHGNPLPAKEIKERLTPDVVTAAGWSKWWTRAKGLLRKSGFFRVGDRSPYLVEKVEVEVSYAEELLEQFRRCEWPVAKKIARQVARRSSGDLEVAWVGIREALEERTRAEAPHDAIEAALILQRGDEEASTVLHQVLEKLPVEDMVTAFQQLPVAEEQRRAVQAVVTARPADVNTILALLVRGKSDALRDSALGLLEERDSAVAERTVAELLQTPQAAPEAFCAFLKARLTGKGERPGLKSFAETSEPELLAILLDLLDHLVHRGQREGPLTTKDIMAKVFALLALEGYFARAAAAMPRKRRREIHARILASQVIPSELIIPLVGILTRLDPELGVSEERPLWEDRDHIYVTAEGLERKQEEFREITEVKLPENFKAIGRAREFGDLSENAEYTSALEERDQLTKRATEIKAALDKVVTLTPDMATTDSVGLGSRVALENLRSGERTEYAILGPWDGSPEGGILSYRSPLALALLGHALDEEVEAELPGSTESYRILSITSYFV